LEAVSPVVGYDANALVVGYRGNSACLSGHLAEAMRYYAEGLEACSRSGELEVSTWLMCLQSQCFLFAGDTARAVVSAQGALTVSEKLQSPLSIGMSAVYLARALVASGEVAHGIELAERGIELSTLVGSISVPFGNAAIATAELESGRYADAREAAVRGLEWAESLPMQNAIIDILLLRAEIEVRDPESATSKAVQFLDRAERVIEQSGVEVFRPRMEELRAAVARGNSEADAALAGLLKARALYEQIGAPLQVQRLGSHLEET
jgi:hypothetical protein